MANLAFWLLALVAPMARKVLVSLGIGVVTYVGLDVAIQGALNAAKASIGALPADVALIVARFGFFEAMSILAGAAVASVALVQLKKFAVQSGT